MSDEEPLLDTLADMTSASLERADLDPRTLMMVRLAALTAVGGTAGSYLLNIAAAAEIAVALGFALDLDEALTASGLAAGGSD